MEFYWKKSICNLILVLLIPFGEPFIYLHDFFQAENENFRPSKCYFHWAGCEWKGSFDKLAKHAVGCDFRFRPVEDVKEKIEEHVEEQAKATRFKSNILNLFSSDNVMYLGKNQYLKSVHVKTQQILGYAR